jgi:hypothetical protein
MSSRIAASPGIQQLIEVRSLSFVFGLVQHPLVSFIAQIRLASGTNTPKLAFNPTLEPSNRINPRLFLIPSKRVRRPRAREWYKPRTYSSLSVQHRLEFEACDRRGALALWQRVASSPPTSSATVHNSRNQAPMLVFVESSVKLGFPRCNEH